MFALGVRLWTGKDMAYPSRFSVLIDFETRISSMRTYIDNNRIDSKTYMMLTPGNAINGEIYELDIICSCEDENLVGVVEFDSSLGAFVAYIDNKPVYITSNMAKYEIVGNIFEDWEEFRDEICNFEKFDEIINENKLQNEENEKQAMLKAKKEEEKKQKEMEELPPVEDKPETSSIGPKKEIIEENPENLIEQVLNQDVVVEDVPVSEAPLEEVVSTEEQTIPIEEQIPDIPEIDIEIPENLMPEEFDVSEISEFEVFVEDIPVIEDVVEPDFEFEDEVQTDIKLYVDGQGGKDISDGGFSYIMQCGDYERIDSGFVANTTKQRMELQSVITALSALTTKCNVKIYTTSQYLIVPFLKGWISRWKANDWKKESDEEIKNKDLWEELYELYSNQNIEWEFIKPGSSIVEILRCIDLSKEALAQRI